MAYDRRQHKSNLTIRKPVSQWREVRLVQGPKSTLDDWSTRFVQRRETRLRLRLLLQVADTLVVGRLHHLY